MRQVGHQRRKMTSATVAAWARRYFVDSPLDMHDPMGSLPPLPCSAPEPAPASPPMPETYMHPLETAGASFKLYGEMSSFANDDANRIFSSGKIHSYDPAVLYADLRLQSVQDVQLTQQQQATGDAVLAQQGQINATTGALKSEEDETDAVMREGRDKQGAAGAAAVAAAMLETTKARVDGIAMVPGHPLPVVFPRPDGLPPPLRFVRKFGSGGARQTRTHHKVRISREEVEEMDPHMYGEVMSSDRRVEGHSIKSQIAFQVCVLDELRRPTKVRGFQHFREISDTIPERVLEGLALSGFTYPTLLQSASVPLLLEGKDMVVVAPNGSGKSVAYAIPSIAVLMKALADKGAGGEKGIASDGGGGEGGNAAASPLVVALGPARQSVQRIAATYCGLGGEEMCVAAAYDAKEQEKQNAMLREGCDVLVSTPARLCSLMASGIVSVENVRFLVADEVDKIVEVGEGDSLRKVLEAVKENRVKHQMSLCSSAMCDVESLTADYLSPQTITVIVCREERTNLNVKQILYPLQSSEGRLACLKKLYEHRVILKREQVLLYCAYKESAEALAKELATVLSAPSSLIKCVHSGTRNRKRNQILQQFKKGEVRILVGTDIGTRRLDVIELEHVVNFDLPATTDTYVRRISHVTAGGRNGTAHTFFTPNDRRVPMIARFVEEQTGKKVSPEMEEMIKKIEETGGDDDWSTPLVRLSAQATSHRKWRVRGRTGRRSATSRTSTVANDSAV